MLDFLYHIDTSLLYFLNGTISNPLFDKFFVFITEVKNWYLTYLILLLITFFKGGRLGKISSIAVLFLITVSDQVSSFVLKDYFARIRPCNVLPDVNILVTCTESFSFPSSHAVNNFAVAVFFAILFPKLKWVLYSSAFLIALSRPYCGVHYPSDIIGGAVIGALIGYIFAKIVLKIDSLFNEKSTKLTDKFERIEFK